MTCEILAGLFPCIIRDGQTGEKRLKMGEIKRCFKEASKRSNLIMAGYLILIRMLCVCVVSTEEAGHNALIKKKIKFSSYIRKFGWDRVQSHI